MRSFLSSRPLRLLFAANCVSMIGSGMNTAAVNWYILQATHSEQFLGILIVVQAIPALHRDSDIKDWIADTLACGIVILLIRWRRSRSLDAAGALDR